MLQIESKMRWSDGWSTGRSAGAERERGLTVEHFIYPISDGGNWMFEENVEGESCQFPVTCISGHGGEMEYLERIQSDPRR